MDFNFFNWLRNGVKKSVLLGVADAIDEIGVPDNDDQFQKKIAAAVTQDTKKGSGKGQRRLGRSLKELNQKTSG